MPSTRDKGAPGEPLRADGAPDVALSVLPTGSGGVRQSRMSRRRAISLVIVHLLILGHIAHWLIAGRTVSPVEPSEAMYTLNDGQVNAGFIFFAVAIASTLLLGRFVCGWGCHLVAYQDLSAWLLKRVGIKPKAFRSRILVFAPLALALYMFVWPSAYRWWVGASPPPLTNHLLKTAFWETFPGPIVAILTVLICGFAAIYFLGAKGFCTYACPYGGFFRLADKAAPGQILVTDACQHCGHCTAVCSSNVRVHEEVALYGRVVDPGCMKCMDCVSVCPNDALYFGFALPSVVARPTAPRRAIPYDFAVWEEALTVVVGVAALLTYRGLYGRIPLLLAMAMAGITAYLAIKSVRLIRNANVRLQNLQLKRGGRLTRPGVVFCVLTVALFALTAHGSVVQYHEWRGHALADHLAIGDDVWSVDNRWWQQATQGERWTVDKAIRHLGRADRWGLMSTPSVLTDLVWVYLAGGRVEEAERVIRRLIAIGPNRADTHRSLAVVLWQAGRADEAEEAFRRALALDPTFAPARVGLCAMLRSLGRFEEAIVFYRDALAAAPTDSRWRLMVAETLIQQGRVEAGVGELEALVAQEPELAVGHYNLGYALLGQRDIDKAVEHLTDAVRLDSS